MRQFINTTTDDLWTAIRDNKIIESVTKPKPYKDHRELDFTERSIVGCSDHFMIILMNTDDGSLNKEHRLQSMANLVCLDYPELADKHGLVINTDHEYWKKK